MALLFIEGLLVLITAGFGSVGVLSLLAVISDGQRSQPAERTERKRAPVNRRWTDSVPAPSRSGEWVIDKTTVALHTLERRANAR
ncbi:MAG TPA: hypothetical protein VL137_02450 [Polyangiaceae bacterium]|jgi:hypothetical protein|nr:hypothetical protein [Polyangiaceae bacterium]